MLKKNKSLKSLALCLGLGYPVVSLDNSFALDLEYKVKNAQEYCLKRIQESSGNLVFNIKGNIIEIPKEESSYYGEILTGFLLNGRRIEKSGFKGQTFITYYGLMDVGELSDIVPVGWGIDRLDIRLNGNVEVSIGKGYEKRYLYVGRFNRDCSFKENPLEASIYHKIYSFDPLNAYSIDDTVVSYSPLGGHLYFNAEKSQYIIDILGTIRNTNFPSDNRVISLVSDKKSIRLLLSNVNNVPDGKGESGFAYFTFFPADYNNYTGLPSFFKTNYTIILAVQRNFGDGQVFMLKEFKYNEPVLESTPFRISAEGVISDIRKMVTLKEGIQVPKPVFGVQFGSIRPLYTQNQSAVDFIEDIVDPTIGYRVDEDYVKRYF